MCIRDSLYIDEYHFIRINVIFAPYGYGRFVQVSHRGVNPWVEFLLTKVEKNNT